MATISSGAFTPLSINSSKKPTLLSSSSSICFSYNVSSRAGLGFSVDRHIKSRKRGFSCNSLFGLGVPELVVIAGVAALVFGPKKLPEVGRSIGKTVKSFQQAAKEFESELTKDGKTSMESSSEKITPVSEAENKEVVSNTKESS